MSVNLQNVGPCFCRHILIFLHHNDTRFTFLCIVCPRKTFCFWLSVAKPVCHQAVRMVHQFWVRNMQEEHPHTVLALLHHRHQVFRTRLGNLGYIPSKTASLALRGSIEENFKVYLTRTMGQMGFVPLGSPFFFQVNLKFKVGHVMPHVTHYWMLIGWCGE